ncbi:IS110 family transposase [Pseudonocardia kujensis]|uniref:IS110 family transposase n=1 Tax=Pseudonocardia kujensis TaxID=1128675 RepID=UPI001E6548F3|nr:IS110 family transposase [Pseudonocardia kujensis]MCE0763346.1 IS110 family transposase [Pseudonocardia kujensis]
MTGGAEQRVVIAVDPHKASWTAAVVSAGSLQPLATLRVAVSRAGYRELRRFAQRWPRARWAIEGATGLGAPLLARLTADDIAVVDVPAKLAARVRLLSTGHGRKNDDADALSVGTAAHTAPHLRTAEIDQALGALRVLVEHRDDLIKARTQLVNRLHVLLTQLVPAGASHRRLTVEIAAGLLRRTRAQGPAGQAARRVAVDLVAKLRRLERRIATADADVAGAVKATGSTLTELYGVGPVLAGKILAAAGPTSRFRSAAAFASFTGTAPIEVSSGDAVRYRLSRAGHRGLNHALHMMALTQIGRRTPGQAYYQRKRAEGKSHKEAMRCLKRRLPDVVYRRLLADSQRSGADPGGHTRAAA